MRLFEKDKQKSDKDPNGRKYCCISKMKIIFLRLLRENSQYHEKVLGVGSMFFSLFNIKM